ncbi:MAG: BREX system ATP-binding domain-containing protein [bacterium]
MGKGDLDPRLAKAIIHKLGSFGTPPEFGIEYFSVGVEQYLRVIEDEYLKDILKFNLSSFKLITGNYGGGKTHFLYSVRNLGWRNNYVTSYVTLSPTECPFDRLELVYKKIVLNLRVPTKHNVLEKPWDVGIDVLLRTWVKSSEQGNILAQIRNFESSSFTNAIKAAIMNLLSDDDEGFLEVVQWLRGEEVPREVRLRYRISERIDRSNAFRMLRSLVQFVHSIGYAGLLLLFDEAERGMSISSARDKRRALDNLRQLVDECGNSRLPGAMFFYAIPDENLLLEGSGGVYEALKQRLRSSFTRINPMGVKINLEDIGMNASDFLGELGEKLAKVFEAAYECRMDENLRNDATKNMIDAALEFQALDVSYRRIFVIGIVEIFQRLKEEARAINRDEARQIFRSKARMITETEKEEVESEEF